jgi:hypothetical protein
LDIYYLLFVIYIFDKLNLFFLNISLILFYLNNILIKLVFYLLFIKNNKNIDKKSIIINNENKTVKEFDDDELEIELDKQCDRYNKFTKNNPA